MAKKGKKKEKKTVKVPPLKKGERDTIQLT